MEILRIRSFSGLYFHAFRLDRERYSISLHIQSKCGKIRNRKTPNADNFHAVDNNKKNSCFIYPILAIPRTPSCVAARCVHFPVFINGSVFTPNITTPCSLRWNQRTLPPCLTSRWYIETVRPAIQTPIDR